MSEHIYEDSDMEHENYHIIPFGWQREEIVRCRDCKHFTAHDEFCADIGIGFPLPMATVDTCDLWAGTKCRVEPDGFCAWAVRRYG